MRIVGIGNIHLAVEVSSYYSERLGRIIDCKPYAGFYNVPTEHENLLYKRFQILLVLIWIQTENHTAKLKERIESGLEDLQVDVNCIV